MKAHTRQRPLALTFLLLLSLHLSACTSLNRELAFGRLDSAREMLRKGEGDVNQVYSLIKYTPLMYASHLGAVDIVEALLAKGARTDLEDVWGNRATHHACAAGGPASFAITKMLLDRGEPIDIVNSRGYTLLHAALSQRHPADSDLVRLLLERGIPFDSGTTSGKALTSVMDGEQEGHTPLMAAARKGQRDVVEMLLKKGADTNKKTVQGWTALHYSAGNLESGITSLLLDAGARPTRAASSALALHLSGRIFLLEGLRHVARAERGLAIQRLRVAVESFEAAAPAYTSEAKARSMTLAVGNVLMFAGAATQARMAAQRSAAVSPSGRGIGVATYQEADIRRPLHAGTVQEQRAIDSAQATASILNCVEAESDENAIRRCLPDALLERKLSTLERHLVHD